MGMLAEYLHKDEVKKDASLKAPTKCKECHKK